MGEKRISLVECTCERCKQETTLSPRDHFCARLVECRGGCLIIKHFEVSGLRGVVGMIRHLASFDHDVRVRKHDVVIAAGELLERAGLPRGARGEDPVVGLETDNADTDRYWHKPWHMRTIH